MGVRVTLIPGDGIGPEVTTAARKCIEATGVPIEWEIQEAGEEVIDKYGTPLPDHVLESIKKNKVALKGPIITPIAGGFRSVNVEIRKRLNLYACVRPCKLYPGVKSRYENVDIVVVRENTEDLYSGMEFNKEFGGEEELSKLLKEYYNYELKDGWAISFKLITEEGARRIVDFAFRYARENNRKKVTCVHKANILKFSDGLFLEVGREVAKKYPDIEFQELIVDNTCMQLVLRPHEFDVLVLPNLYGDIVSDLCAGLVGGLGVAPGANIGDEYAVFEPTHGAAPKYKGQNKVNPTATILSGVMMLRYLGFKDEADRLENAVAEVIKEGKYVTYDLKPTRDDPTAVGTQEMADAIDSHLKN
ncbi:MAG TPA: isocitrate/isopropylmalate dehydrogenase family protein [Candidatus Omnitrophica bacterium]|nr:isocitrate/isopropylmalate dehydrogenase family protein [Candidatus Omnitrophota bacterium]